ncbi:MAG: endonuclease/exonuclease/phosphatase family protein [Spirochaetales bacterium]|nr:endonuclease/exonuclease/phosphatase family protein [Spirochaetales bacterium]
MKRVKLTRTILTGLLIAGGGLLLCYISGRLHHKLIPLRSYEIPLRLEESPLTEDATLSVASYNIAHGRGGRYGASNWQDRSKEELLHHLDLLARQIRLSGADVVVLNEVDFSARWSFNYNQAKHIAEKGGYPYVVEQSNIRITLPFFKLSFGNALLSRYPIGETAFLDFSPYSRAEDLFAGNHDGAVCFIEGPAGTVAVGAVHLEHRSEETRLIAARRIAQFSEKLDGPFIIMGDFNSTPAGSPHAQTTPDGGNALTYLLTEGGFTSSSPLSAGENYLTFPSDSPVKAIDWILTKGGLSPERTRTIASPLSDHLMVVAEIGSD